MDPAAAGAGAYHLLMLAALPFTWIVACLAPDFIQVSHTSSGSIGSMVRQSCAPFSFQFPAAGSPCRQPA